MHIMGQLFEYECLSVISVIFKLQFTIALNSLKKMVPSLSLNFLIFLEELLTSMVYMGVDVTTYTGIYDDGVKASAPLVGVPH
jgi:hypothetical protein